MNLNYNINLYGYSKVLNDIYSLYILNRLPNKLIFSGNKGTGKATMVFHLINLLLSKNKDEDYDTVNNIININSKTYKLISSKIHPNFFYINKKDEKNYIEISQIRELNNFIYTSSLNDSLKIIMIDDAEFLSTNSANSLLKIIEEPNKNVQFILVFDNSKFMLETLKSRCINYKLNLNSKYVPEIINNFFQSDIYQRIPSHLKNIYLTPIKLINIINLCDELEINLNKLTIEKLLYSLIDKNLYKKKNIKIDYIKEYIEIYFLIKLRKVCNTSKFHYISYINKKFNDTIRYNLDLDSFFIEFKNFLVSEK